jgi:inner membrane protein
LDTLTHALLGALVAQAAAPRRSRLSTRERLLLAGTAAAFPDVDFAGFLLDPLVFLADWHQGPTHSLLLMPLWALLLGGAFVWLTRRTSAFVEATLVCALALTSHIVSDLITVYGTAILAPWSDWRPALGLAFVIDLLFTGIVAVALILSLRERNHRLVARVGLVVLCGYVGTQVLLRQQALDLARDYAYLRGIENPEVAALPQPFSPFNWTLLVIDGDRYHRAQVNLIGHPPPVPDLIGLRPLRTIAHAYRPPTELRWESVHRWGTTDEQRTLTAKLWQRPDFAPFRRFAAYPSLSRVHLRNGESCVWFTDLRYDLPALPDTFRYGFCRTGPDQDWRLYRLRYFSDDSRQPLLPMRSTPRHAPSVSLR